MSKYMIAAPKREPEHGPKRPTFCAVADCLTHWNAKDAKHEPGFADVVFTLNYGTVIARCADHYLAQIYKAGRGSHCDISGRQPDLTIDMVREQWARVDADEQAKALRA